MVNGRSHLLGLADLLCTRGQFRVDQISVALFLSLPACVFSLHSRRMVVHWIVSRLPEEISRANDQASTGVSSVKTRPSKLAPTSFAESPSKRSIIARSLPPESCGCGRALEHRKNPYLLTRSPLRLVLGYYALISFTPLIRFSDARSWCSPRCSHRVHHCLPGS